MKTAGIAGSLPSRLVTNEEIVNLVEQHSKETFQGDLPKTLK
ncbi:hypothetical protein [Photorhabdus tasmaniensis]|nr:hypothetical protein [Photorhabdus tasmaniensis]